MFVRSDKYKKVVEDYESNDSIPSIFKPEIIPVDMYGKRVNLDENDPTNFDKTAHMIQDYYGLASCGPMKDSDVKE